MQIEFPLRMRLKYSQEGNQLVLSVEPNYLTAHHYSWEQQRCFLHQGFPLIQALQLAQLLKS